MKGEKIPHTNGVYTARRDPVVEAVWGESRSILARYTHQCTEDVLDLVWTMWREAMTATTRFGRKVTPPLPPPRFRWLRRVPCHPNSIEADEGFDYLYQPATPGAHGAFPCIEFNEHTLAWEEHASKPPRIITVHLPEVVPTP